MTLPPWAEALRPLLPNDGWLVLYRSRGGPIAARTTNLPGGGAVLLSRTRADLLRDLLPPGARAVACHAAFLLHDDTGLQALDGDPDARLPDGEADIGMPDLFCRPDSALALPRGVWTLEVERLSAHARLVLADACGPALARVEGGWIARVRAGAVLGRADPRFSPEAVARG